MRAYGLTFLSTQAAELRLAGAARTALSITKRFDRNPARRQRDDGSDADLIDFSVGRNSVKIGNRKFEIFPHR